ncbi:putative N-acetyltransferase YhbS [Agromyces cerinus]|uniref:GNAT family N-acetyltransferase n=1 Tax=Agromyces cerinus TaxID=33878 RepID=UPI00195E2932|nr:N-acetyltransferase [Agromyces cerinus]MBM7832296.1 putative N-acetyltransferase YhbS [Agromyces cerinus]
MPIRPFRSTDRDAVERLLTIAFATPTTSADAPPIEVGLNTALLDSDALIPKLALVAEVDGEVVGYCISTRASIGDAEALGLGPIGVLPGHQGRGIGAALIAETVRVAESHDEGAIVLLGDPAYYGRFGFVPGAELGILAPDPAWGEYFQAIHLAAATDAHCGRFRYARPFEEL